MTRAFMAAGCQVCHLLERHHTEPGCQSSVNLIDGFIEPPYSHPP
jgi:hypothetical protein